MSEYLEQSTTEVHELIQRKEDIQIIDVREDDEWESGHIAEATHIRLSEIPQRLEEIDRNRKIVMVCRSGGRSGRACEFLSQSGFHVTNMQGGMLEWTYDVQFGK
jgi:rhodanese-related sulfurtransferase